MNNNLHYLPERKQNLSTATIMIVDDEPINIDVVQAFLEDDGYSHFVTEEDPRNALPLLESSRPDLLLLDLMMPEVSGFEVLQQVRNHPQFKHLPVIILTASTDTESKLKALELGATDFLAKPLDQSELALRVRNTLFAKAYQDQLAYYDPVTKLPNRQLFMEDINRTLAEEKRLGSITALLNLQIDQFSDINNQIGQAAGDAILHKTAERIQSVIRDTDALGSIVDEDFEARLFSLSTNTFLLLLLRMRTADSAAEVVKRVQKIIAEPIHFENHEIYLSASIGIATCPLESESPDELLHLAASAKDSAQKNGGNRFCFSSKESMQAYEKRLSVETKLRHALENKRFVLHYQPKVEIESGEIVGAEALIRWQTEDGLVFPNDFIPLAEETGLIIPIGLWCLEEGCGQLKRWHQAGADLTLSINLSARQFADSNFMSSVERVVAQSGIDPNFVTLELTESLLIDDLPEKIILMQKLNDIGFKLSIDDFGTGYSSLSYLRKLPVHELKIDRSFIMETTTSEDSRAIVATVIFLAKQLGLSTVAEGIEQLEELNFLRQLDCDQYQGFYFSRPVPCSEFAKLLNCDVMDMEGRCGNL